MSARALIIESDGILLQQYSARLAADFEVVTALTAQHAIDALDKAERRFDVIILDVQLGKNNGVELLHEIRSYDDWIDIPALLLSTIPLSRLPERKLARYGVAHIMYKPQSSPKDVAKAARRVVFA